MKWHKTLELGLSQLRVHKLRSMLTLLGVIFGITAVISMMSISEGARDELFALIKLMGMDNITVRNAAPAAPSSGKSAKPANVGLTMREACSRLPNPSCEPATK